MHGVLSSFHLIIIINIIIIIIMLTHNHPSGCNQSCGERMWAGAICPLQVLFLLQMMTKIIIVWIKKIHDYPVSTSYSPHPNHNDHQPVWVNEEEGASKAVDAFLEAQPKPRRRWTEMSHRPSGCHHRHHHHRHRHRHHHCHRHCHHHRYRYCHQYHHHCHHHHYHENNNIIIITYLRQSCLKIIFIIIMIIIIIIIIIMKIMIMITMIITMMHLRQSYTTSRSSALSSS